MGKFTREWALGVQRPPGGRIFRLPRATGLPVAMWWGQESSGERRIGRRGAIGRGTGRHPEVPYAARRPC